MNPLALALVLPTLHLSAEPVRTLEGEACRPWARIECWLDGSKAFEQETFNDETSHLEKSIFGIGIPEAFGGTRTPHSRYFLLHYAPGWDSPRRGVPILLVHGAQSDATRSWASTYFGGEKGLMWTLSEQGFAVFAVTFPCGQGKLYYQAEHVANAIAVVKKRTGTKQVDVLGHSAGGISTRMYLTGVRERWGTAYRGDVRKVIFVATPHQGLDFVFRHPIAFVRFHSYGMPAPWDWFEAMGEVTEKSVYGPAYTLQRMLLADLTAAHPLNHIEPDWYTTWNGGSGFVSRSRGLAEAIRLGGNHMAKVRAGRFHDEVEVFVLAGTKNRLTYIERTTKHPIEEVGEFDGPSDGIVFVDAATDPEGLKAAGALLRETKILSMNHVELLFLEEARTWIATTFNGGPLDDERNEGDEEGARGDAADGRGRLEATGGDVRDPGEGAEPSVPVPGGRR